MRANFGPPVSLDFLDGYLFRLLQEIASEQGLDRSGFENYYGHRIAAKIGGLIEYEAGLARYLLETSADRRIVHAGIGVGTLACALACNGMTVAGVEYYPRRVESARRLRAAFIEIWPEVEDRYAILQGNYPQVLMPATTPPPAAKRAMPPSRFALPWRRRPEKPVPPEKTRPAETGPTGPWFDANAILIFTNVASSWDETMLASIIETMPRFAEVILDLGLFGSDRESETERIALFDRLATRARSAERLPQLAAGSHFARFVFV